MKIPITKVLLEKCVDFEGLCVQQQKAVEPLTQILQTAMKEASKFHGLIRVLIVLILGQ